MRTQSRRVTGGDMVAWGYALLIVGPLVWILSNSFKRPIDILMGKMVAPVTDANYVSILFSRQSDFLANLLNSAIVAVSATALALLIATVAAFTIVRLTPPRWVSFLVLGWALVFHMLPTLTFVGSWYVMFSQANLHGTYLALILTHTVHILVIISY